ncbi:holin family protein [Amaricoccus solimangrovi]|uniref:Methionine synthase I n=1 Tax=Amaricoccus solimangrovi TaxID=2589815 RepID=A0A501WJB1_9RHOB|nr:holin family protein [Amaricoccus solimangrovi]TPE49438.1 methionine synthase I [Amaricoccus solimangrovi]
MGLIGNILGAREVAGAVGELAQVFVGNRAERDAAEAAMGQAALSQYAAEFQQAPAGWFDRFMNGLNRLPRPLLVAATLGLFAYSMISPEGFARRMEALALVPEPLWWLLGAIVSFYFGARELHYARGRTQAARAPGAKAAARPFLGGLPPRAAAPGIEVRAADPAFNAAIEEWRATR